jgi:branched-chain amino acid transport system ATP-binding protein
MLKVENLEGFYGASQALFGMAFAIEAGEVVTLMGRNGMGKTTTVHAVMGLLAVRRGTIEFEGQRVDQLPAFRIARLGLGLVPEGRQIFPNLSVRENLVAASANRTNRPSPWTLARVFEFFPRLAERQNNRGNQLSGGEQQMLAIGRALLANPRLIMLDEATEGLAPIIRDEIWRIIRMIRESGVATLIVDKSVAAVTDVADRIVILVKGEVVFEGSPADLKAKPELMHRHLGV